MKKQTTLSKLIAKQAKLGSCKCRGADASICDCDAQYGYLAGKSHAELAEIAAKIDAKRDPVTVDENGLVISMFLGGGLIAGPRKGRPATPPRNAAPTAGCG